ncbi:hypothetical protein HY407_02650 [Candidatus Gottesmanbacteria bacterium]|nr:hypothetical protein [Candidatus Gottesmanbacteria bacterium]
MTQVSRRLINKKTHDRIYKLFISGLIGCNSFTLTSSVIEDLLTPTEQVMLAKRFSIAYMLLEGYDYRTISSILRVSSATINAVATTLHIGGSGLRSIVMSIKKDEKMKEFVDEFSDALQDMIASARGQNWSASKKMLWQARKDRQKAF